MATTSQQSVGVVVEPVTNNVTVTVSNARGPQGEQGEAGAGGGGDALTSGTLDQFANVTQKGTLLTDQAHLLPPFVSCLMVSSFSLEPRVVPNSKE